jgi:hypothetical protein
MLPILPFRSFIGFFGFDSKPLLFLLVGLWNSNGQTLYQYVVPRWQNFDFLKIQDVKTSVLPTALRFFNSLSGSCA